MTTWDWMFGDKENEGRDVTACQLCSVPLGPHESYRYAGLELGARGVGLCEECAEENLPALCDFCHGCLGFFGSPDGGDAICEECLSTYHRDRYRRAQGRFAWEDEGTDAYEKRMAGPEIERLRLLAEAEERFGGGTCEMMDFEGGMRR